MAITFNNKPPKWENGGVEPTSEKINEGYEVNDTLPADYLNYHLHRAGKCIDELQTKLSNENTERLAEVKGIEKGGTGANTLELARKNLGIDKVPNVATNDQTPTYSDTTALTTLQSGEKLNVAMQKIKCAITNLINHIKNRQIATYSTFSDIGQTIGSETIEGIANGMPNNSVLCISISATNAQIYPSTYGVLKVIKRDTSRVLFDYVCKATHLKYIGFYDDTTTPKWYGWSRVLTDDTDLSGVTVGGANWAEWANHLGTHDCSNKDFNTLKTSGFYYGYTGMTNAAFTSEISVLEVIPYSNDWVLQRQTKLTDGVMKYRFYSGVTGWSEWYLMYTSKNPPSVMAKVAYLTYSGTGKDGSQTFNTDFTPRLVFLGGRIIAQRRLEYAYDLNKDYSVCSIVWNENSVTLEWDRGYDNCNTQGESYPAVVFG